MKKIILSILILLTSFLLFSPRTYAFEMPTEYISVNSFQDIPLGGGINSRFVYLKNDTPKAVLFYPWDGEDAWNSTPYYLRFKDNNLYNKVNAATQTRYLIENPGATDYSSVYIMSLESEFPEVMANHHYTNTYSIDGVFQMYFRVIPLGTSSQLDDPYTVMITLLESDLYFSGEEPSEGIPGIWLTSLASRDYIYFRFNSKANPGDEYESKETISSSHYTEYSVSDNLIEPFNYTAYLPIGRNALTIYEKDEGGQEQQVFFGTVSNIRIQYTIGAEYDGFNIYSGTTLIHEFINPYYEDGQITKYIKMYFSTVPNVEVDDTEDLPLTSGTITSETGTMGIVNIKNINLVTHQVDFEVLYNGISYTFDRIIEDISFLVDKEVTSAYYYSDSTERFIYFDYSVTMDPILLSNSPSIEWNGFAIWNLSALVNAITFTDKIVVLTYFSKEEANNIYAYFYMPDVILDDLLSATLEFDYVYYRTGFPDVWNQYPMETRHDTVVLEAGEKTESLPDWTLEAYKYVAAATIIGSMIPVIRWPVLILGTAYLSLNYINNEYLRVITKDIDQIQQIIPSQTLKDTFLDAFDLESIDTTTNKMYKLYIGQYLEKNKVEIIAGTEKYTQLVYVTQGNVVILDEEFIEADFERDDELLPAPDPTPLPQWLMDLEPFFTKILIIAGGIVALLILPKLINALIPVSNSGYYKKNKRQSKRNTLVILAIIAAAVLLIFLV